MPGWYLILSAVAALLVLGGVAYSALTDARRTALPEGFGAGDDHAFAEGEEAFDAGYDDRFADAPTRREAEEGPRVRPRRHERVGERRH